MESVVQDRVVGWARVFPTYRRNFSKRLRHGTWYPVVRDNLADRVSLVVGEQPIDVPRRLVEIRPTLPRHFSVVDLIEPAEELARNPLAAKGKRYAVCPDCARRQVVIGRPPHLTCASCGYEGEVGWWEAAGGGTPLPFSD